MFVWLRFRWRKIRQHQVAAIVILVGILVIVAIILGYRLYWNWTGFNNEESKITITTTNKGTTTATESLPAKNLWDWLQLLAPSYT